MDLLALPIGAIMIFAAGAFTPPWPAGWIDIFGTPECLQQIEDFRASVPELRDPKNAGDQILCIKKIREAREI